MKKIIIKTIIILGILLIITQIHTKNIPPENTNTNINTFTITTINNQTIKEPIFTSQELPNYIYENMLGNSIPLQYKNYVDIHSLAYLQVSYFGFDNEPHIGELIVNAQLSNDVLEIFKELYEIKYPIEKIKLIDEYNANDELSMSDNNTSCFCYRVISGTSRTSNHATGTAIDINPLYNPHVTNNSISPVSATPYANRNIDCKYQINKNDSIYQIFIKHGWAWGGDWSKSKDYQHFEKKLSNQNVDIFLYTSKYFFNNM